MWRKSILDPARPEEIVSVTASRLFVGAYCCDGCQSHRRYTNHTSFTCGPIRYLPLPFKLTAFSIPCLERACHTHPSGFRPCPCLPGPQRSRASSEGIFSRCVGACARVFCSGRARRFDQKRNIFHCAPATSIQGNFQLRALHSHKVRGSPSASRCFASFLT